MNLVDFDQQYGHRNDVEGYAGALEEFDRWLPSLLEKLAPGDLLIITADHGCDPTTPSTDHSREFVPLLAHGAQARAGVDLGTRTTLSDIGQTVARELRYGDFERNQLLRLNRMRKPVMAGNWKMYKTPAETHAFFEKFKPLVAGAQGRDIVICPPFPNVYAAVQEARGTEIQIGAQNLYWGKEGAVTGEISGHMIQAAGCTHVIVGHSERRQFFNEAEEEVLRKTIAALENGLTPIVCVGERLEEREGGMTEGVLLSNSLVEWAG